MPCSDGRERYDGAISDRKRHAFAALLCGYLRGDHIALRLAKEWCAAHWALEKHGVEGHSNYDALGRQLERACDATLYEAWLLLCLTQAERDKFTRTRTERWMDGL